MTTTNTDNNNDNDDNISKGIEVICPGLGRTGTLSLSEALTILGYKPYHYIDFKHHEQWVDYCKSQMNDNDNNNKNTTTTTTTTTTTVDDIINLIVNDGYNVTVENPTSDIYIDILKKYPNAKVILTKRDNSNKFVTSWKLLFDTMILTESTKFPNFFGYIPLFKNLKIIRHFMGTTHLQLNPGELTHTWRNLPKNNQDDFLAKQYDKHNEHIINTMKQNNKEHNLLIFNVKDGWEPLCQFLNKDIPTTNNTNTNNNDGTTIVSFPHCKINNADSLRKMKRQFQYIIYGWIPTIVCIVIGTTIYFKSGGGGREGRKGTSDSINFEAEL